MYRARVGDIFEYQGYIGEIIAIPGQGHEEYTCANWLISIHPEFDFYRSHPELGDWCVPEEHLSKFKLICNVRDFSHEQK